MDNSIKSGSNQQSLEEEKTFGEGTITLMDQESTF
jgi:hypothetical protein